MGVDLCGAPHRREVNPHPIPWGRERIRSGGGEVTPGSASGTQMTRIGHAGFNKYWYCHKKFQLSTTVRTVSSTSALPPATEDWSDDEIGILDQEEEEEVKVVQPIAPPKEQLIVLCVSEFGQSLRLTQLFCVCLGEECNN